jgi:hypothetical protein
MASNVKAFVYNSWVGGQATDKKTGIANSFADSQSLDFRTSPSQMSVLPATRRADSGVVTDLVQDEVMVADGTIYAIGSSGNVYKVSPAGVWSLFGNIGSVGTFGINWREDQDAIYIPGTDSVSQIINVSTTPTLQVGFYGTSQSTYDNTTNAGFNVNSNQNSGTLTTTLSTTYTETNTQERFFQTDINPIYSIGVKVIAKGTGDWTLVVHDGLNNQLGTSTITNANLVNGTFNEFVFSTPIQINVPTSNTAGGTSSNVQTYHFHLTSTVADGTVASTATNDLSTCDMDLYANRLVNTKNGIHAQVTFQQFECITNGRYLSVWEPLGDPAPSNSEWERQGLTFPAGFEGCGVTVFNEYLVIATQMTVTGDNTAQKGILFYWDGLSSTYNYFTPIPEGYPESIHTYENAIYYEAGGNWYTITSVAATPQKIRRLPGTEDLYNASNIQTHINPNMGTVRYGVHLLGWPSTTKNPNIPYGVYTWGRSDTTQPYSFGYSYLLSTGSQFISDTNNLTIGMVKNFGNVLHISWRDGSTYGVDIVDADSDPAPFASWESLIEDSSIPTKQKMASYVEAHWLDIQDGVQIVLKYSINRGDWVYSERFSNSNLWQPDNAPNYAKFDIGDGSVEERFYEVQIGVDIYCDDTVTEPPVIVGVSLIFDTLGAEALQ